MQYYSHCTIIPRLVRIELNFQMDCDILRQAQTYHIKLSYNLLGKVSLKQYFYYIIADLL